MQLSVCSFLVAIALAWPGVVLAQSCPDAGAGLAAVRQAITDLGKSDRAPAAADCALKWASTMQLEPERLREPNLIRFFQEAADLHRRAYEKRRDANRLAEADKYLGDEIALRRRFLEAALRAQPTAADEPLSRALVRHLSSLAGALGRRQQFEEIDKMLSNTDASVIDEEAVNVWLQALWSCAKFDGKALNLCTSENQRDCKDRIEAFLARIDEMKGRRFPPLTRRDIDRLRSLTGEGGCLR